MLSTLTKTILLAVLVAGVTLQALAIAVVYIQPHDLSGTLYASSSSSNDYDQFVWDDFTLPSTASITQLQWRGGYDPAYAYYAHPVADFIIGIYDTSIANEPNVGSLPLVEYQVGGNAGETAAGTFGGIAMYDYRFDLPAPFQAQAGAKYWLQIEATQAGVPNWGLARGTGGTGTHFWASVNYAGGLSYRWGVGDTAFTLLGPEAALSADFTASPVSGAAPLPVVFTNTSLGDFTSSQWNFGDGSTSTIAGPTHLFASSGQYTVALTISGTSGSSTRTRTNYITVTLRPSKIFLPIIFSGS